MTRAECLDAALAAVNGTREGEYGGPEDSFSTIAALWSVVLGVTIQPHQVALCLGQLKVARLIRSPGHADSWVDLAGYGACGAEVATRRVVVQVQAPGPAPGGQETPEARIAQVVARAGAAAASARARPIKSLADADAAPLTAEKFAASAEPFRPVSAEDYARQNPHTWRVS